MLFIGISLNAQISINLGDYPTSGQTFLYDTTNIGGLNVGASGANAIWDFSNMTSNYNYLRSYSNPSTSTSGTQFPTANLHLMEPGGIETFFTVDSNKVEIIGRVEDLSAYGLGMTAIPYTNTMTSLNFPINYNDSYTDNFEFSFIYMSILTVTTTGSVVCNIDAFGKLITPNDTIDCIREYAELNSTVSIPGTAPSAIPTIYQYTWVALGYGGGVMDVTADASGNIESIYLNNYSNPLVSSKTPEVNEMRVRTDINNSFAVVEWKNNDTETLLSVYDLGGRCLKSIALEKKYHILDLNEFSSGSYIISISGENTTLSKQLIVK